MYNGEAYTEEFFKSILILLHTALGQNKLEMSVYDDTSTDRTWLMLKDKLNTGVSGPQE
jgi:hypothetical protein